MKSNFTRNLAAGAIILFLLLLLAVIIMIVPANKNASLTKSSFADFDFSYDGRLFEETKGDDSCQADWCLENIEKPNRQVEAMLAINKIKAKDMTECLGVVSRVSDEPKVVNSEILFSDRSANDYRDLADLSTEMRVMVGNKCYEFLISSKTLAGPNPVNTDRNLFVFDQLLDVAKNLSVDNYNSTAFALYLRTLSQELYSNSPAQNNSEPQPPTDGFGIGQVAFQNEEYKVTFVDVLEDSRCPMEVQCVQAGQVVVEFTLKNVKSGEVNNVSIAHGEQLKIGNESLTLISVLPERTLEYEISKNLYRVKLQLNTKEPVATAECVRAGCSNQLCISKSEAESGGGVTTCEYREEYACYQDAECKVQESGECGFTETEELNQCLLGGEVASGGE